MADPNQTPKRGDWVCPCTGCMKSRKLALNQVLQLLDDKDMMYGWHQAITFINEELKKK